jgi:hypothetical protein
MFHPFRRAAGPDGGILARKHGTGAYQISHGFFERRWDPAVAAWKDSLLRPVAFGIGAEMHTARRTSRTSPPYLRITRNPNPGCTKSPFTSSRKLVSD